MTRWYDNDYGGSLKMIVRDDTGFRVFVSVPSSIEVDKGSRVTFTANITPASDDPTFSFGKRPTKASVLAGDDDDNECEGHESLDGAHMGETVYCDGTCRKH